MKNRFLNSLNSMQEQKKFTVTSISVAASGILLVLALIITLPFGYKLFHLNQNINPSNAQSVLGQNYQICNEQAQYLTSKWTYNSLASGSQTYTVAQYEALSGYGTTLPPLPSYIANEPSTTTAAVIFAPGSTVDNPAYDYPETPILYFFEGGSYGPINFASITGDEFIGGSAPGFPEPIFNDGGNADGISSQNGSHDFSGGESTLAVTALAGATTVTTNEAIPGYIYQITFANGSTYSISSHSGTSITLGSPLSNSQAAGSNVW